MNYILLPLAFFGATTAIGMIGAYTATAIARNPEASSKITPISIMAMAFAEAIGVYTLIVYLIEKFV